MAERLAAIFGTEKDKVNCPFYFKIGACRHGDRCSRVHNKPPISPTIVVPNMYQNPVALLQNPAVTPKEIQDHFDDFYEDVYNELAKFGELEDMNVCDNLGDHLIGNLYVKFFDEQSADAAVRALNGRFYAGRQLVCEFCPVTDFKEARCRQFDQGECVRGGYCNFMHLRNISPELERELWGSRRQRFQRRSPPRGGGGYSRKRPRSPPRMEDWIFDASSDRDRSRRHRSRSPRRERRRSRSGSPERKRSRRERSRSRSSSHERRSHKRRRTKSHSRSASRSPSRSHSHSRSRSRSRSRKSRSRSRSDSRSRSPERRSKSSRGRSAERSPPPHHHSPSPSPKRDADLAPSQEQLYQQQQAPTNVQ